MNNLKGTRTEANLLAAFAGESQARNKYTYFAEKAKEDGYEQIAKIFEETADNEKAHAEIWYKLLHNGMPTTQVNLQNASADEHFEATEMYTRMAKEAKEEGFDKISSQFALVAEIEKDHEQRYLTLIKNINDNKVFKKDGKIFWICGNCGHIHEATDAPDVCAVCAHPKAYFQQKSENYK